MDKISVRQAISADLHAITALACILWPDHAPEDMEQELATLLENPEAAVFLALWAGHPFGFAQCQLRHDYVEGCETSPVGYLEGIFIAEGFRRRGAAARLLSACEDWARSLGCSEFASDCELDNADSLIFHQRLGFEEANRIICFLKTI